MNAHKLITALMGLVLPTLVLGQPTINKFFDLAPAYDAGLAIRPTMGGGYALFGYQVQSVGGKPDAFMLRVDSEGNAISHHTYGAPTTDDRFGRGIIPLPNGWLAAGTRGGAGWIVRVSTTGQAMWEQTYPDVTRFNQLLPLPNGHYLGVGLGSGYLVLTQISPDGLVVWHKNYAPLPEGIDAYLTESGRACIIMGRDRVSKIHLGTQQVVWSRIVDFPNLPPGAPEVSRLVGIAPVGNGLFALIGSAYRELPTSLYTAHYAAVWNERGEQRWSRYFRGGERSDYDENEGFCVTPMPNSQNILFVGKTGGSISVTRTDLNGNVIEQKAIATPGPVYSAALIRHGSNYAMTGGVLVGNVATFFYHSGGNTLSMQVSEPTEQPNTLPAEHWDLQHEPALARAWITAQAQHPREATFRLWALDGSLAREMRIWLMEGENRFPIDLSGLHNGPYWLSEESSLTPPKMLLIQR